MTAEERATLEKMLGEAKDLPLELRPIQEKLLEVANYLFENYGTSFEQIKEALAKEKNRKEVYQAWYFHSYAYYPAERIAAEEGWGDREILKGNFDDDELIPPMDRAELTELGKILERGEDDCIF